MSIVVNNIYLNYEKTGQGRPFILLHGNGEDLMIFDRLIGPLSRHFTVYALDSRGHGKSAPADELGYDHLCSDVHAFIQALNLKRPIVLGFSDGGIVGLLLASRYPDLLGALISCGANTSPAGLKGRWLLVYRLQYLLNRDPKLKMMFTEPQIQAQDLARVKIPTLVVAGSKDIVTEKDTLFIKNNIRRSELTILNGETHGSYVTHNEMLYPIIIDFLKRYSKKPPTN